MLVKSHREWRTVSRDLYNSTSECLLSLSIARRVSLSDPLFTDAQRRKREAVRLHSDSATRKHFLTEDTPTHSLSISLSSHHSPSRGK